MIKLKNENSKLTLLQATGNIELDNPVLKGEAGGYYIPEVSANGDLSWTATENYMPIPETVNIRGSVEFDSLSEAQKQEIIEGVIKALPNGDEVYY